MVNTALAFLSAGRRMGRTRFDGAASRPHQGDGAARTAVTAAMRRRRSVQMPRGFTLIELLVVIAIMSLLTF